MIMFVIPSIATSLYFISLLLSVDGQYEGYIQHGGNEHKLILPAGNVICYRKLDEGTKLVFRAGGDVGPYRPLHMFEFKDGEDEYGYIRHLCSGKYVHPLEVNADNDTELVYRKGKCQACTFKFERLNGFIVHKDTGKVWYPKSGKSFPEDNTAVVLRSAPSQFGHREVPVEDGWVPDPTGVGLPSAGFEFAKFKLVNKLAVPIPISPVRHIIHSASGKLVYPLFQGLPWNTPTNTSIVTFADGIGDELMMTYVISSGHIMHVSSGKFVVPSSRSLDPPKNDKLVLSSERHDSGRYKIQGDYILHGKTDKVWRPLSVDSEGIPPEGEFIVLGDTVKNDTSKFHFENMNGVQIQPF